MKIVAVVPTLNDDLTETVQSILDQSVEVSRIFAVIGSKSLYDELVVRLERAECIYVKPDFSQPLGKRVAVAINTALAKVNVEEYDYVLKVDADVVLPRDFVKENLSNLPDFVGSGGSAMLFNSHRFLEAFGGKYPEVVADDAYLASKFLYEGYTVKRWLCSPRFKIREKGHHSYRHGLQRGIEWYKLGFEPVHIFSYLREFVYDMQKRAFSMHRFFPVVGYFLAALRGVERYEFASWIFMMQVRRLIYGRQFKY
jgi:hypothetical protein